MEIVNFKSNNNSYRDKLRILLILYFFSEEITQNESQDADHAKIFKSEVRIQKIDFLIRYPDYLAYELLGLLNKPEFAHLKEDIKEQVKRIFKSNEPEIRREEMLRYFFGAYEEIDHIIAFFISTGFVVYKSKKNTLGREFDKLYYLTKYGVNKIDTEILRKLNKAEWYEERCQLIKKYFGDLTGTELKVRQYEHEQYRNTPINKYIKGIQKEVKSKFYEFFGEEL
ncbi:hypothetical protein ACL9SP_01425 [Priestia flexa]|uniref:hypothetical protein n=1 Tax=Priestia flexa TaxID=86664 RepID=UPI0039B59E46